MEFHGKVVLVTGSTSGIGSAIAIEFAKKKAKVIVSGRRISEGHDVVDNIKNSGGDASFVQCDVTVPEQVQNLVRESVSIFGKLDISVNNAGITGDLSPLADYSFETWNKILATNLTGVFLGMKYQIPELLKTKNGVILNVGSALGLVGYPKASAYSATKHAIIGLTKSAAFEYGKFGIRINVACLGGISTEMDDEFYKNVENPEQVKKERLKSYALGNFGTPEQAAKSCVWLCSEDASFITAAAIPIAGGKGSI